MIPTFPAFKTLELSDREEIENITRQFPPHSDFHFISIFCWDINNSTLISILNNNLILKQIDCLTGEQFFSFIGINLVPQTAKEIFNFLNQNMLPLTLRWVPEETVACLNGMGALVTEDRDYFDYIYNISDFFQARGRKNKSYRNDISRFIRNYPSVTVKQIDITSTEIKNQINNVFKNWTENKELKNKECEPLFEHKALNKLLSSSDEFSTLVALGMFDRDEIIGFIISDIHDGEYGSALFWKANTNYVGVYQFLMKETISLFYQRDIKFMSFESDLGIPSLKEVKLRYNPSFFLKKYKIEISN